MTDSKKGALVWGAETSSEERMFALIAHLAIFFLPVLVPLLVYLLKKDESKYLAYHAMQAIVWQLIAWIIGGTLCLGIGTLLGWIAGVLWAIKAHNGEWTGYPLIEGLGREG